MPDDLSAPAVRTPPLPTSYPDYAPVPVAAFGPAVNAAGYYVS